MVSICTYCCHRSIDEWIDSRDRPHLLDLLQVDLPRSRVRQDQALQPLRVVVQEALDGLLRAGVRDTRLERQPLVRRHLLHQLSQQGGWENNEKKVTVGRTYAHNEQARVCAAVRREGGDSSRGTDWIPDEGFMRPRRRAVERVRCPVRLPGPWTRGEQNDKPNEQFNKTSPMTRLTQNTKGDDKIKTETETQDATRDTKTLTTALRVHVPGAAHGG